MKKPLNEPSVKEFADAFLVVKSIGKGGCESIDSAFTRACTTIIKACGIDPDKTTEEQAFTVFDQFMFVASYLYAFIIKNPEEVTE